VAVAADNSRFVSGGGDKTVFLWDVATARTLRRLGGATGGHGARIESVKFGGDGDAVIVSGSYDASVRLWDTKAQGARPLMVFGEGRDSISDVAVAGFEVGAASVDGRVRWYDLRMGLCVVDVVGGQCIYEAARGWEKLTLASPGHISHGNTARRHDAGLKPGFNRPSVGQGERQATAVVQSRLLHEH